MGTEILEHILSMDYQNACLTHRDLEHLTKDEERRRAKTYEDLYNEYQRAVERLKMENGRDRAEIGKAKTTTFKGTCNYCGKPRHKGERFWDKHPKMKPKWA